MAGWNKEKWTWRYLLDTAISLKKGDFNTPSVNPVLKKENGGFDCYFKTAAQTAITIYQQATVYKLQSVSNRIGRIVVKERADNRIFNLRIIGSASLRLAL